MQEANLKTKRRKSNMFRRFSRVAIIISHTIPRKTLIYVSLIAIAVLAEGLFLVGQQETIASAVSESGSIQLGGNVPGPPPQFAAVIQQPAPNQKFTQPLITVSGTCPGGSFVQILRNGIFAGATPCNGGAFSLKIDLVIGKNDLMARVYDNLGQFGPDSATVTVYYEPPNNPAVIAPGQVVSAGVLQLLVTTDSLYHGVTAGSQSNFGFTISGGQVPYALVIKWGDGTESVFTRDSDGQFTVGHAYKHGGIYKLTIAAIDALGNSARLETVILVNGPPLPFTTTTQVIPQDEPSWLATIWPYYLLFLIIILAFLSGNFYQAHKKNKTIEPDGNNKE